MARNSWREARSSIAKAKEILAKYEYHPHRMILPPVPNELDRDIQDMLRKLK